MKTLKILLTSLVLLTSQQSFAQNDDLGMAANVEVSKKIFRGLDASIEEEFRLRDNMSETDRFSTALGLSYKLNPYFKFGGAYNLINYNHPKKSWEVRHRYYLFIQGSYSFSRFNVSLRERFQSTYREGVTETSTRANPKKYLRSKISVSYNIRKSKFEPFTSCEFYNTLNDKTNNRMDRISYILGSKYKLNKRNSLEFYYRYINFNEDDDAQNKHIIGVGYSHKF